MVGVREIKVFVLPVDAMRLTGLSRAQLAALARRGVLTHYRTKGNHRRYDISELRGLRQARGGGR